MLLALAIMFAPVASATVSVRIVATSVRLKDGKLILPRRRQAPRPRTRPCPDRDAPPTCRLIVYDLR